MSDHAENYRYIIVGGGTAGCVVAARLSEDPDATVLLIEAGAANTTATATFPPAWPGLLASSQNWGGAMAVQSHTGTTPAIGRGRGLGGSTLINAMVFARGHRDSYADWADAGAKGWGFDDLLPYFMRSESAPHGDPSLRGHDGPLAVAPADDLHEVVAAMLEGAVECGHPEAADVSGGQELGFAPVDLNIVDGRRHSAADAYMAPALKRPNLRLLTDASVHRVLLEGKRAVGVEYGRGGAVFEARGAEVILCAGAVGTPQVLMLSGIGPAHHLREVGVAVAHDLPGVGSNFQDHPISAAVWTTSRPAPQSTRNHGEVIGLIRTHIAETDAPDLQLMFAENLPGAQPEMPNLYGMSISALQPHSRGTVRLESANPAALPVVDPNYLGDERDLAVLVEGVRVARDIGNSAALSGWRAQEVIPGSAAENPEALKGFIKATLGSHYHPAGSCAIGDTADAVVDSELRVHGIGGLRVVDASVMPSLPSNNTVATVYALAERGADLIRRPGVH